MEPHIYEIAMYKVKSLNSFPSLESGEEYIKTLCLYNNTNYNTKQRVLPIMNREDTYLKLWFLVPFIQHVLLVLLAK